MHKIACWLFTARWNESWQYVFAHIHVDWSSDANLKFAFGNDTFRFNRKRSKWSFAHRCAELNPVTLRMESKSIKLYHLFKRRGNLLFKCSFGIAGSIIDSDFYKLLALFLYLQNVIFKKKKKNCALKNNIAQPVRHSASTGQRRQSGCLAEAKLNGKASCNSEQEFLCFFLTFLFYFASKWLHSRPSSVAAVS